MHDDCEKCDASEVETDDESETQERLDKGRLKLPPHEAISTNRGQITRTLRKPLFSVVARPTDIAARHILRPKKMNSRSAVRGGFMNNAEEKDEETEDNTRTGAKGRGGRGRGRY